MRTAGFTSHMPYVRGEQHPKFDNNQHVASSREFLDSSDSTAGKELLYNAPSTFIVLEGISGSGKTELGKKLARTLRAQYYTTPPEMYRRIREDVDRDARLEARFLFYLSSVVQASWEIGQILESQSVVCDKYIWSALCYHSAFGLDTRIQLPADLRQPDHTFLIVCDDTKRLERLRSSRGAAKDKEKYARRQDIERRCLIEFRKHILQEIDNTADGPDRAVEEMLRVIQRQF